MAAKGCGKIINQTTASTTVSDYVDTLQSTNISIHVVNGNITGTLYLEASDSQTVPGVVVSEVVFEPLVGTSDSQIRNVSNCNSRFYRVGYNHSSGTGKLVVFMTQKGGDR